MCHVELALWDCDAPSYAVLYRRLFAFYDQHRCQGIACSVQQAYERAESAAVRIAEHAQQLEREMPGELPMLYDRVEGESLAMAARADDFAKRARMPSTS